jgi:hypothetical protein
MSFNSFIPEIWSGKILLALKDILVAANLCNTDYEGEVTSGSVVKINSVGAVNVNTYSGTITNQVLTDAQKELKIDQKKYFSLTIDDVDNLQSTPKLLGTFGNEGAFALMKVLDTYILATAAAGAGIVVDNSGSAYSIKSTNIIELLGLVGQKMDENSVPTTGRYAILPPWMFAKLSIAKIALDTNNSDTFTNGFKGRCLGFDCYSSNNIVIGTPSTNALCKPIFGYSGSITLAQQLEKIEALRNPDAFGDIVRGLHVYGAKVGRPEATAYLYASYSAE